jgi:transposase
MHSAQPTDALTAFKAQLEQGEVDKSGLLAAAEKLASERDRYRELYVKTLELYRKLEQGLIGQKRERVTDDGAQLRLALLGVLQGGEPATAEPKADSTQVPAHTRAKPTGRKPLPEHLPRIDVEVVPDEVQRLGLDAFEKISEDVSEVVERRPASLVVVRVRRGKYVLKGRDRAEATTVEQAAPLDLPIQRGLAGPGLLADTLVRRWQDHLPANRLENIYARDGLEIARSTICGWQQLAKCPPSTRTAERVVRSKPLVDRFFRWCDDEVDNVVDESPIAAAIGYARNQRLGLQRFLGDGRLPIHNNHSELALRRQAIGRKNWLFVGSDDGGQANATFVTLLASAQLHRLEPWAYLRDLLCLLPDWPRNRVLELSPLHWKQTCQLPDTQQRLLANPFRAVTLSS